MRHGIHAPTAIHRADESRRPPSPRTYGEYTHKRIRTARTLHTRPEEGTASTVSTSATTCTPIATEERPPPTPQVHTEDGASDLSQETLGEHVGGTDGPTSHAQDRGGDVRPMDTLVTAGNH